MATILSLQSVRRVSAQDARESRRITAASLLAPKGLLVEVFEKLDQ